MVLLSSIYTQYPWNPNAPEDWHDKEVLTIHVSYEDASRLWKIPLYPCLQDFAFVGFRVRCDTQIFPKRVQIVSGDGKGHPLFGKEYDLQTSGFPTVNWTFFRFPLPTRLLSLNEDEYHLEVEFETEAVGKVEVLAQEINELKDAETTALWFQEIPNSSNGWILTRKGLFYTLPTVVKMVEYPEAISLYSLVQKN